MEDPYCMESSNLLYYIFTYLEKSVCLQPFVVEIFEGYIQKNYPIVAPEISHMFFFSLFSEAFMCLA